MTIMRTTMLAAALLATGCYDSIDAAAPDEADGYAVYTPGREQGQDFGLVLFENNDNDPRELAGCTWTSALPIPMDASSYVEVQVIDIPTTQVASGDGAFFVGELSTATTALQAGERVVFGGFPYDVSPGHRLVLNINQHGDGQPVGYGSVWLWW